MTRPTLSDVMAAIEDQQYSGFCIACGAEKDGCEPDARNYCCDECGEHKVFGAEEILIMGAYEDDDSEE